MGRHDCDPNHLKIMPGTFPPVWRCQAKAQNKFVAVHELIHPVVRRSPLEQLTGADLPADPHEAPVPAMPATDGGKSRQGLFFSLARREGPTIRELSLCAADTRGDGVIWDVPVMRQRTISSSIRTSAGSPAKRSFIKALIVSTTSLASPTSVNER